jgi:hypothetical protein
MSLTEAKPEFSWDDVYTRRRGLAAKVQKRLDLSFSFGVKKPFSPPPLTDECLVDKPMWCVPFYVIAHHNDGHRTSAHPRSCMVAHRRGT